MDPGSGQGDVQFAHLLRRTVRDDQAVHARVARRRGESLQPVPVNGVDVAHENDGDVRARADPRHGLENPGKADPGVQRALIGPLVHDTVRQGIRERHAELHDIRAARLELADQGLRDVQRRIAGRQERNQAFPALGLQPGEHLIDPVAIHAAPPAPRPSAAAATSTSLSPRPDRLRTTTWRGENSRAIVVRWATA